jgi:ribosomal 50S subunit-associated protein YjgA (DUF615 family)
MLKDQFQSYTDEEQAQRTSLNDSVARRAVKKSRTVCSVCQDQRRRQAGNKRKLLRQEDDDSVRDEIDKLRRENGRLVNEKCAVARLRFSSLRSV